MFSKCPNIEEYYECRRCYEGWFWWNKFIEKLQEGKEAEDEDENTLDDISGDEVSSWQPKYRTTKIVLPYPFSIFSYFNFTVMSRRLFD